MLLVLCFSTARLYMNGLAALQDHNYARPATVTWAREKTGHQKNTPQAPVTLSISKKISRQKKAAPKDSWSPWEWNRNKFHSMYKKLIRLLLLLQCLLYVQRTVGGGPPTPIVVQNNVTVLIIIPNEYTTALSARLLLRNTSCYKYWAGCR